MRLTNSFTVPATEQQVWALLNDVPQVVPCMPGARLEETLGADHWKAGVAVTLGPVALVFDADVERTLARDGRLELRVKARETRGRGAATATVGSQVRAVEGGSSVDIETDLMLAGAVAQYARGIAQQVASQMIDDFSDNLRTILDNGGAESARDARPT